MGIIDYLKRLFGKDEEEVEYEQCTELRTATFNISPYYKLADVKGVGKKTATQLEEAGIFTANELADADPVYISENTMWSMKRSSQLIENAKEVMSIDNSSGS